MELCGEHRTFSYPDDLGLVHRMLVAIDEYYIKLYSIIEKPFNTENHVEETFRDYRKRGDESLENLFPLLGRNSNFRLHHFISNASSNECAQRESYVDRNEKEEIHCLISLNEAEIAASFLHLKNEKRHYEVFVFQFRPNGCLKVERTYR